MRDLHTAIRDVLNYDPDTGRFTWTVNRGTMKAGWIAGHKDNYGRPKLQVFGQRYLQSRLAWYWMTGAWPKDQIDHINQDHSDNRWLNLREATCSENQMNRTVRADNKIGYKGVRQVGNRFRAVIWINGKNKHLGYFDTWWLAHRAYWRAAQELHGEFAHA